MTRLPRFAPNQDGLRPAPSVAVATALSFVFPGLGQWYAGDRRSAAVYALPTALLAVFLLVRIVQGWQSLALQLLNPDVALFALVLVVALGAWRLISMADAAEFFEARRLPAGRPGQVLAGLALVVLATHAVLGFYVWKVYENANQIFVDRDHEPGSSPSPGPSVLPSGSPGPTPFATPETEDDRITILLTGIDKASTRTQSLTDTLLVLSVDPSTGTTAMISFPRDIAQFPLYNGGTFPNKINSLMTYAERHPDEFPDGPMPSLARELGFLLGIPIHYYAAVDLDGFRAMIDEVGGVTVNVEREIRDFRYDWLDGSPYGFFLKAGTQTLNGRNALAFVRSRYGIGDNDFTRAARQQQLLLALRAKLTDAAMLPRLPAILDVAGDTIRTNFPPERIGEMVELAQSVDDGDVTRVVLKPPTYSIHPPTNTTNNTYILRLHLDAVRQLSVSLFGEDSAFWTGEFDAAGSPVPASAAPSPTP